MTFTNAGLKQLMVVLVTLFLMAGFVRAVEGAEPANKLVKIYVTGKEDVRTLANLVAPWEVHEDHILTNVTDQLLQEIEALGFVVEIVQEGFPPSGQTSGGTVHALSVPANGPEGLYHSYSELTHELFQLEAAYPQIAKVHDIGDTWEKTQGLADRDIWALVISDNVQIDEGEPEVLFMGNHHAREWISVEVPLYLAKYLLENYATDPQVKSYVDHGEIWIVPMVNPDGHQYSIDVERWWRKNRRDNGDGTFGVDLNRNYGHMWGGTGSSPDPGADIYRGTEPFSEPEVRAIRDLTLTHNFQAVMTYHSYGQLVLYPWAYTGDPPADAARLGEMASEMAVRIQQVHGEVYTPMQSSSLYPASGLAVDWFYGTFGMPAFNTELRPDAYPYFNLPEAEIVPTWEENKPAALYLIASTQNAEVAPVPDIKANAIEPILLKPLGSNVNVTIQLNPGSHGGENADWWTIILYNDLVQNQWTPVNINGFQYPLLPMTPVSLLNTSNLARGFYIFFFGIDLKANGVVDTDTLYHDIVGVLIY